MKYNDVLNFVMGKAGGSSAPSFETAQVKIYNASANSKTVARIQYNSTHNIWEAFSGSIPANRHLGPFALMKDYGAIQLISSGCALKCTSGDIEILSGGQLAVPHSDGSVQIYEV